MDGEVYRLRLALEMCECALRSIGAWPIVRGNEVYPGDSDAQHMIDKSCAVARKALGAGPSALDLPAPTNS